MEKKLSICEQLIKLLSKKTDPKILEDVTVFTTNLIKDNTKTGFLHQVIYNTIQLKLKGIDIEPFNQKAYDLTLKTLLDGKLSLSKTTSVYSFFKKLPVQNLYDHLVVFLRSDNKLREVIVNSFEGKRGAIKVVKEGKSEKFLRKDQISFINSARVVGKGFESGLADLMKLKENKVVADFLNCILLSEYVDPVIKDAVSKMVIEFKIKNVMYDYLAGVQVTEGTRIAFLPEFLNALGSEDSELCLRDMLLTEKVAQERPRVFVAVLRSLASDQIACINSTQKNIDC